MDFSSKKLLVLDVNGLLVDTYFHKLPLPKEKPDAKVGNFYVFKRPFCEDFLQFCLENFVVGIWSSAREHNVNNLIDYVFGDLRRKLAFSWHQLDCTDTGLKDPLNRRKPIFLKELSKLWKRVKPDLPWSKGDYSPANTLLVDDTPYKAIFNPPNTGIFPLSYVASNTEDNVLGFALRNYLKGIRDAVNVQIYVEKNPFGEPCITSASPHWSYFSKILPAANLVSSGVEDLTGKVQKSPRAVSTDYVKETTSAQPVVQYSFNKYSLQPSLKGRKRSDPHVTSKSVEKNAVVTNDSEKQATGKHILRKQTPKPLLDHSESCDSDAVHQGEGGICEMVSQNGLCLLVDALDFVKQTSEDREECVSSKQRVSAIVDQALNGKPSASKINSFSFSKRRKLHKESVQCQSPNRSESNNEDQHMREKDSSLKVTHGLKEDCSRDERLVGRGILSQRGEARGFNPSSDSKGEEPDITSLKLHRRLDLPRILDCPSEQKRSNQKWDSEEQDIRHNGKDEPFRGQYSVKFQNNNRFSEAAREDGLLEYGGNQWTWGSDREKHDIWSSGKHARKSCRETIFNHSSKEDRLTKHCDAEVLLGADLGSDLKQQSGWRDDQEGSLGGKWEGKSCDETRFVEARTLDRPVQHRLGGSERNLSSNFSRYAPHHSHHKYLLDDNSHSPKGSWALNQASEEDRLTKHCDAEVVLGADLGSDLKQKSGWRDDQEGSLGGKWEGKSCDESRLGEARTLDKPVQHHLGERNLSSSFVRYAPHQSHHKHLLGDKSHSPKGSWALNRDFKEDRSTKHCDTEVVLGADSGSDLKQQSGWRNDEEGSLGGKWEGKSCDESRLGEARTLDRPVQHHLGGSERNLSTSFVRYAPHHSHHKYLLDDKFHSPEGSWARNQASKETRQMSHHVRGSQRDFSRSFVGHRQPYDRHKYFQGNYMFQSPKVNEGTKHSHHRRENDSLSRGKDEGSYDREMDEMGFNRDKQFYVGACFERSQGRYRWCHQPRSRVNIGSMNSGEIERGWTWQSGLEEQSIWSDHEEGSFTGKYVGNSSSHSRFRYASSSAGSMERLDKCHYTYRDRQNNGWEFPSRYRAGGQNYGLNAHKRVWDSPGKASLSHHGNFGNDQNFQS